MLSLSNNILSALILILICNLTKSITFCFQHNQYQANVFVRHLFDHEPRRGSSLAATTAALGGRGGDPCPILKYKGQRNIHGNPRRTHGHRYRQRTETNLFTSSPHHTASSSSPSSSNPNPPIPTPTPLLQNEIQLLGQGMDAPIQPGVVLLAPSYEYSHFLKHAAIFIYAMGTDEVYKDTVIRGVLLDQPTAFSMGEMCPGSVYGELAHRTLFTGGNQGKDSVLLFHRLGTPPTASTTTQDSFSSSSLYTVTSKGTITIQNTKMIGSSGVFQGGIHALQEIINQGILDDDPHVQFQYPHRDSLYKFFFNYIQFTQKELILLLQETDPETNNQNNKNGISSSFSAKSEENEKKKKKNSVLDVWTTLQVPSDFILRNDWERGEAWAYLKNYLSTMDRDV